MKKMNPKVKAKWVKALRSGEYMQGKERLCTPGDRYDTFCCLGVLTDLAVRAKVTKWWDTNPEEYVPCAKPYYDSPDLPSSILEWAGLDSTVPILDPICDLSAIDANDERKYSFNQIADLIEKNL